MLDARHARITTDVLHSGIGDVYYISSENPSIKNKVPIHEYYKEVNALLNNGPLETFEAPAEDLLELQVNIKHPDHFHSRSKISDDCAKPLYHKIELNELFQKAEEYVMNEASRKYEHDSPAKKNYIEQDGNIVVILGEGKVGKTMLTRTFFERFKLTFRCVFYIDLVNLKRNTPIDLLRFLLLSYGPKFDWLDELIIRNSVIKYFDSISHELCIIIDGLDHLITKGLSEESLIYSSIYDSRTVDFFLKNIMSGHIFSKSKKLITARSYNFYQLSEDCRPSFVVWAVPKSPKTNECTQQILQYLNNQPDIKFFCRLPLNWKYFLKCFPNLLKQHNQEMECVTCIFSNLFALYIKELNLSSCKSTISHLTKFVFSQDHQKFVFEDNDLQELELPLEQRSAFLTTFLPHFLICGIKNLGDKQHYFSQILIQEFLQAFAVAGMALEEFEGFIQEHLSPISHHVTQNISRSELAVIQRTMMFKFMCGLLSIMKNNDSCFKHIFPGLGALKKKTKFLLDFIDKNQISCNCFPDLKYWNIELHNKDAFRFQ